MAQRADGDAELLSESGCVRVTRTESVPADSRVRHFDELSDSAQDVVAGADDGTVVCGAPDLSAGEVIVFTDYYRIE